MSERAAPPIAWGLCLAGVAAIVAAGILSAIYPFTSAQETYDPVGEFVWAASWIGFGVVGALIVTQRPTNRIGWVLVGITSLLGVGILAVVYGRAAYENPAAGLPLGMVATWFGTWTTGFAFGLVLALLLLFPSAELASRRQRWLGAALAMAVLAVSLVEAVMPGPVEGEAPPLNPLGLTMFAEQLDAAQDVLAGVLVVLAVLVLLDFVYRFWRSRGVQRQQFRWLALAASAFPFLFVLAMVLEDNVTGDEGFDPVVLVFFVCGNGLAAAIGVAVTRHGLYEINRVISRSVTYVMLTAVLAALYLAAVTLLTSVTAPVAGDSPLAVAAATLAVAAAFGPARRRIQGVVDRRFNRARYDAARMVEAYRGRLRDEVDVNAVATRLLATVNDSMQPAGAVLWLSGDATGPSEKSSSDHIAVTVPERPRETRGVL